MKKVFLFFIIFVLGIFIASCDKTIEEKDNPEINVIIELINKLPEEISLEDESNINLIETKYLKLSEKDKEKITNYNVFEEKKLALESLKLELNNNTLAGEIINLIDQLPNIDTLKLSDKETILNVKVKYDNLTDDVKVYVSNVVKLNDLLELVNNFDKVESVIESINDLPIVEELELVDEEAVLNVRVLYNSLSDDLKKYVSNLEVLISCEERINSLKQNNDSALEVIKLIDNLPTIENLLLTDKEVVLSVKKTFDSLTDSVKNLVTNVDKLNNLLEIVYEFDSVESVINSINNLPSVSDLALRDEEEIISARELYESLNNNVKHYVNNLNILEEREEAIVTLKNIANAALEVTNLIDNLPSVEDLKITDKTEVENARNGYNNLSKDAQSLVSNIEKLEELEEQIIYLEQLEVYKKNALVVVNLINKLPENVTLNDRENIESCLDAYENLNETEKSFVINFDELTLKYKKLSEIIANTSYNVKLILDGGYLEGMKEIVKNEEVCEFVVNNYSCNIWTVYSSNIFIYKTTLMKSEDQFTSFIKVGFSYNLITLEGEVNQFVPAGTPLDNSLRTSDYYILVHPNYNDGYSKVSMLEIGTKLSFNTTFPDSSTDSLNCNINAYNEGSDVEYMITLTGINTLPIPQKAGYKFVGWYKDSSFTNIITEVKEDTTVYAKWMQDKGEITTESILNCVSDVATSNTTDELILENDDAYYTWSSSNNKLYNVNNGLGTVSKMYQTHKKQTVKVSVEIKYKTGGSKTLSKDITVNPVLFNEFSKTPIATYFYTGAVSAYKKYNERYKTNQTLFSDTTKETLDIVYYAFIVPESNGSVSFQNTSYLDEVKELKNHNVRILGCVNGVGTATATAFKTITADATLRKTFINNLMNLVEQYNLDGLDLDWEAVSSSLTPIASQYNLLCEELRAEMTRRQDEGGSPYLLTMAVPASSYGTSTDRFDFKTLNKYVDYINIMSYDLNNPDKTTHLSPLYSSSKDNGYGFGAVYGVNRISSLGFDKNKLIIGCAGYGKAYSVSGGSGTYPALGLTGTLTKISGYDGSFASGTVYGSVIDQLIKSGRYQEYTEMSSSGQVVGSYLYSATDKIFITYDSRITVMAKYEYAASNGVGMMCWAYTEDTADIVINAIYEAKNK